MSFNFTELSINLVGFLLGMYDNVNVKKLTETKTRLFPKSLSKIVLGHLTS